ncbi:TPA: hypothetical protein ACGPAZ_000296 [Streptococcus suis]|uniref:hypothetical protein n=2 Tax=Streptococcus TaxID=1301 RepID=UPI000789B3B4|nr:hypothetical protein [Streptococcus parauberis]KYP25213.1 hypothetical protein TM50_01429 [Streptococcus parauberis]KYP25677.1 hypothetical protein ADO04_00273 [Streptococcus parauberis]
MIQQEINFQGIPCTYYINIDEMIITIKSKSDFHKLVGVYFKLQDSKGFKIEFERSIYRNVALIDNFILGDYSLRLHFYFVIRILKNVENKISGITFKGIDTEKIFSPSTYFYNNRDKDNSLLYKSFKAFDFLFQHDDKEVNGSVEFGNILSNGIASDLKLSPIFKLEFECTNNFDFIFQLFKITEMFHKIILNRPIISFNEINLFSTTDKKISQIGDVQIYPIKDKTANYLTEATYQNFEKYFSELLQYCSNNLDMNLDYFSLSKLNETNNTYFIIKLFSSFENLFGNSNIYIHKPDTTQEEMKSKLIEFINSNNFKTDKAFIENIKNKIKDSGNNIGQKKKIILTYEHFVDVFQSKDDQNYFQEFNIKQLAEELIRMRNFVAHENPIELKLDDDKKLALRLLEAMNYCLILEQVGIPLTIIQIIIGIHFQFNYIYMQNILNKNNSKSN